MALEEPPNSTEMSHMKFRIRYLMAALGSMGFAILYVFKVNVSVVLLAMTNRTALTLRDTTINTTGINKTSYAADNQEDGPFVWDANVHGVILSAFFLGYLMSMLPGAKMSESMSAKWVMNGAVLLSAIASLLSPICAHGHYLLFALMRFIQGVGGGVSFPAMHVLISKWAPPAERSIISSIIYSGTSLGMVIGLLLSGIIAKNIGWSWVFYIEGAVCFIWSAAWWSMIEDSPAQQQRFISETEKNYILNSLGEIESNKKKLSVPWRQIFVSTPFLALLFTHFCNNFGLYLILTKLPKIMEQLLKFDLNMNSTLTAFASLCMWIFTPICSKILSVCTDKKLISLNYSRKIGTSISCLVPMVCLMTVGFNTEKRIFSVVLLTIAVTSLGAMYSGFMTNHIDIAPHFAGTLIAITNFFATIPGIIVPPIVGAIVDDNAPIYGWKIVFGIASVFYIIQFIIYWLFSSAEEQTWNQTKSARHQEIE